MELEPDGVVAGDHGLGEPVVVARTDLVERFPEAAQKANIQCENCHGPQVTEGDDSPAHALRGEAVGKPRLSLSSDLCGTCHGEPTRHARFQQWQVSGHGNYELAIGEGDSGDCARCHTANGFLAWVPAQTDDDPANDLASVAVTCSSACGASTR